MFTIEAHTDDNGINIDQTTPEFLGDAYGKEFGSLDDAISKAIDLESDLEEYELPDNTVYTIHRDGETFPVWSTEE